MPVDLTPLQYDDLDDLIRTYRLHASRDVLSPIYVFNVVEPYFDGYEALPHKANAVAYKSWHGTHFSKGILLHTRFRLLKMSAYSRYLKMHEMAHIILNHPSEYVAVWPTADTVCLYGIGPRPLSVQVRNWCERQANLAAAYVLVRANAIHEMEGYDMWYMARKLDVPEFLIPLRKEIIELDGR